MDVEPHGTQGGSSSTGDAVDAGPVTEPPHPEADGELERLVAELEAAAELPLDDRLELLRRTEKQIARALEGLDGL